MEFESVTLDLPRLTETHRRAQTSSENNHLVSVTCQVLVDNKNWLTKSPGFVINLLWL